MDCIEDTSHARNNKGYPFVGYRGRTMLASKAAWVESYGEVPDGLLVLHRCDNPPCINANHLYLGTNQDNMDDMKYRERYGKRAKLVESDVREIRERVAYGDLMKDIAVAFGISPGAVSMIAARKRWVHVD